VADLAFASLHPGALIGRDAEVAIGRETLAQGRGIVVGGPAGVGKTRFASELLDGLGGRRRLRVVGTRAAASIPLGAVGALVPAGASSDVLTLNAIAQSLQREDGMLAILVDDAHLLDDASASLVHRLALDRIAVLVVTIRSGEATPDPVRALWKDDHCVRLELQALSRDEIARLVMQMLPGAVDEAVVQRCWDLGRGNPMFTRELLRAGLDGGRLRRVRDTWTWPGRFTPGAAIGDLIADRFDGFSGPELELLTVVSLGEPLDRGVAAALRGPGALESLARAGLVTADAGKIRLAHPLYGEVVRHGTIPATVERLSRELALAHPEPLPDAAAEIRRIVWHLDAGAPLDAEVLLHASVSAQAHDLDLAARLAQAAIAAGGGTNATLRLADVLTNGGRLAEADALLVELAGGDVDDRTRLTIAAIRATTLLWLQGRAADALAVLDAVLPSLDDASLAYELMSLRLQALLLEGRVVEITVVVDDILATPGLSSEGRMGVLIAGVSAWLATADLDGAIERCEDGLAIAAHSLDAFPVADFLHFGIAMAHLYLGDLDRAQRLARTRREESAAASGGLRFLYSQVIGRAAMLQGRFALAVEAFREATALIQMSPDLIAWNLGLLAAAHALAGDLDAGEKCRAEAADLTTSQMFAVDRDRAAALLAAGRGERSRAAAMSIAAADRALELGQRLPALFCLHDAARLGAAPTALARLEGLGEFPGRLSGALRAHVEAIAATDGDALERASLELEELGCDRWAADSATMAAGVFADLGLRSRAARMVERARVIAHRVDSSVVDLDALQTLAALTEREREIAGLVARGMSDREVGAALDISVRTVQTHLHRAYAKLGITSRRDLAAYVLGY
jgi:DNA-binding CsgD family transcriptional regulator